MLAHPRNLIIWSADVPDAMTVLRTAEAMKGLQWIKLDRTFMDRHLLEGGNPNLIRALQEDKGYYVFFDAKVSEVPRKLEQFVSVWGPQRPRMMNCIVSGSLSSGLMTPDRATTDGLKRYADACRYYNIWPCGVARLTSKTDPMATAEHNGRSVTEQTLFYLGLMLEAGFTAAICSPHEVPAIRREARFAALRLYTPGIRLEGDSADDQAKPTTPAMARRMGVDGMVIGTSLTKGDPAANFRRVIEDLNSVM